MVAQRNLGRTGLKVSEIGLGAWQLGGDWGPITETEAHAILSAADRAGVSFWDTADVYGGGQSEQFIGHYQKRHDSLTRVIATKVGRNAELYPDGYTKAAMQRSIEQSRERLQVDTIDLVQLHCIPFEEMKRGQVFEWLEEFKQQGLLAHYGASIETVAEAQYCLQKTNVASLQLILNVLRQDMAKEVLPLAEEKSVGVIVRLGLASGLLSGTMSIHRSFSTQDHRSYNREGEAFHVGETFSGLPFELGVELAHAVRDQFAGPLSLAELALRWLLDFSAVSSVIVGASKPEQVERNAQVSALPALSKDLHESLTAFYHQQVRHHIRGTM